ncbi:matrix-remodeling-associated protein 5 [Ahaetulla prasina]|uniref:matrix-remodeling-associated protein 5 n=1 Tax=Ahaetulla prasina TaxID=499056 RepID=UPI0026489BD1|nr:matrix-remodeling-associated protein 5 [Ahaetulla prasina]XP_058042712.1 matrix-remodeling-associated protein 5 [Ahaetulla prasina]
MKNFRKMQRQPNLETLSMVLIVCLGISEVILACPQPCACYVPSEVHCTFRSLVAVPSKISKHVERINLGFNSIQAVYESSFAGLSKLELLMLHGNDIQNIPNGALKDLSSLQVFKISYNKLQVVTGQTLHGLFSLMRLHLDHNRIEFIHPNAFNGLISLRLLHLEGNLLQQLHPNTFSTFLVLDFFRMSTIKHLYLSENAIRTLPKGIFERMPLLENIYLHGNPWSCDCRLKWFLEWTEKSAGILKCKKDKAYEDGQFCPKCTFPKQFQKQDIQNMKDISCRKPIIQTPLKQSINIQENDESKEDDVSELLREEFQWPPWNITLNLTDEHKNSVNLKCEIKKPTDSTKIQWNHTSPYEIVVNGTISLDMECHMNRENYEKLWKLIAYYSEVPVKLKREHVLTREPKLSYHYRQGSDYDDVPYYTGVKGRIFAEPAWVMQPFIHIQLNRHQSTGKMVVLSFSSQVSQTIQPHENKQQRSSWVMIEQDQHTRTAQSIVEGSNAQLSCNVKASESPSIRWILPDGTKLEAPFKMESKRFSVLSSGQLIIRSVAYADSGIYHCVAQVRGDVDTVAYRVLVQPPVIQQVDSELTKIEKNVGDSILLPCSAVAIPDAHLNWILPSSQIINDLSNSSSGYLLENGTLLIPYSHVGDSGYYRCVAINQQGSDEVVLKVTVNKMVSDKSSKRIKFKKQPGSRASVRGQVVGDDEGSGDKEIYSMPSKKFHLKNYEQLLKQKSDDIFHVQVGTNKKGKRKMKLWKGIDRTEEINIAEGRRVFESRRRIHMTNKQINPQHWANILAKVRRKSLPRLTTTSVPLLSTTSEIPFTQWTTRSHLPLSSLSPRSAVEINGEESSADTSHLDEAELFSVTIPSIIMQNYNQDQILSSAVHVEHEFSKMPEDPFSMETSVAQEIQFSPTMQTQPWDHSDSNTDQSKVAEPKRIEIFNGEINGISKKEVVPYTQSTLTIDSNREKVTPNPYSENTVKDPVIAESHKTKTIKQYLQTKSMSNVSNVAITFTHAEINNSATIAASAAQMTVFASKKHDSTERVQVIPFNPFTDSKNLILTNVNLEKTKSSSTIKSTVHPLKKEEWMLTAATANKPTTETIITAYERKMSTSEPAISKHSRRRPYGRRRTNRFRRPKPIPPTAFNIEKITIVPKISKLDNTTQTMQGFMAGYQKPEDEIQKLSSSSLINAVTLQKPQDTIATSAVQLPTLLPKTPLTLSSVIKDQKSQTVTSTYHSVTTSLPKQLHLSHNPEHTTATENKLPIGYNEVTNTTTASSLGESSTSSFGLISSVIPELEEKAASFSSDSPNVIDSRIAQSKPVTQQYLSVSQTEHPETLPSLEKLWNFSDYLLKTTMEPFFHKVEKVTIPNYSSVSDHTSIPTEMNQILDLWQNKTHILPTSRYSKEITSQIHNHEDEIAIYRTEKKHPSVVSISTLTPPPPLTPMDLKLSYNFSTKENLTSIKLTYPDRKIPTVDSIRARYSSKQNELSTTQQKQGSSRPYSSFSLNPNIPNQPVGKNPGFSPPKYIHVRGTVKPPYLIAPGFFHHFKTHQVPLHYTNKPEITAYAAYTTQERKTTSTFPTPTPAPLYRPKTPIPGKSDNQEEIRQNIHSKVFVSNFLPESRDKPERTINHAIPYLQNTRTPFLINRTRIFQHLGVNSKPLVPKLSVPVSTTEKTFLSVTKKKMQSTSLKATTIPVPPISLDTVPASGTIIPTFTTPKIKSQMSSTLQSSSNIYYNNPNVLFVPKLDRIKVFNSSLIQSSVPLTQGKKPKIITKMSNVLSVLAESEVAIPCDATGEPKPLLSWTKISTGTTMTAQTKMQRFDVLKNGTLLIHSVQLQDRGQYLCTAENSHGTDKMIVLLTVIAQQPKMLGSRFKDLTVYFGEEVTMDCQATGIPNPHISWIFPNRKIFQTVSTMEGRVTLYENRTLLLKDTNFQDRGIYKCIASNAAGADSIAVRLHIAALPPIIEQKKEENFSLNVGQSINIHCSAKAAPPPGIRWVLFDGTQIRPSQFVNGNLFVFPNGTLYIRHVLPKDSGSYECIAANMVGTVRRTVQLQVKKQSTNAKITGSSPQRTDVTYGSTLRLNCSASGDPWPWILWRLPSKRMVDSLQSLDSRIKVLGNGTLVIHSVTDKDAGDYLCMARNKIGDDYVVLKVNVMMKPAKIEHKNENNHKVIYGGDLKVDCVATGLPNPEISWSLPDGSMVNTFMQSDDSGSRTKRYVVFNNGTLYFNEVGLREEGDYTCYAENQIGKDEMKVRVKVVAEPARIRNKTYVILNISYGDAVSVGCEAKGEPTPRVFWLSPSNRPIPILSDKYQVYIDGTLLIQKAQRSDSGNYTCVARNSAGEDRKIVWIHVNVQPPKINGHPSTITSVREMAVKDSRKLIDCKAEGIPSPRVMWAFPEGVILPAPYYGNRITVHRNGTLDIRGVRHTDAVQLVCIGRNEGGEARLVMQLQVVDHVEKPFFGDPVTERITATAGHSINLNCSVHGTPSPRTAWILPNGTELMKSSHLQRFYHKRDGILHISALSAADAGTYRCTARNPGGYVERVVFLKVGVKPEIGNHYNNLVSIINGETLQLHCATQPGQRARVAWTLPNGMVLDSPQAIGRFSLLENGSLIVREASVFDRGTYLCKVATDYGSSLMNVPVIVIAYPPRITSEPAPVIYARPGNTVKLNCMAIGIPKAEITWELPEKLHLTTGAQSRLYGNKFLHPQGSLIIQQATQRDAGFYKCTAKNILGTDSKATYIHIF